jgi:hypothetical protein
MSDILSYLHLHCSPKAGQSSAPCALFSVLFSPPSDKDSFAHTVTVHIDLSCEHQRHWVRLRQDFHKSLADSSAHHLCRRHNLHQALVEKVDLQIETSFIREPGQIPVSSFFSEETSSSLLGDGIKMTLSQPDGGL